MYLSRISLKNYRCFSEASFELGKITLFMGANSSGKTSVLTALLSSLQSDRFPLFLSQNGDLTETGDFREIAFKHVATQQVEIGLGFGSSVENSNAPKLISGTYSLNKVTRMPLLSECAFQSRALNWSARRSRGDRYSVEWRVPEGRDQRAELEEFLPGFVSAIEQSLKSRERAARAKKTQQSNQPTKLISPMTGKSGKADRALKLIGTFQRGDDFWLSTELTNTLNMVGSFRESFSYLGSQRSAPLRTYYHSAGPKLKIGVAGQNTAEQILAWKTNGSPELAQLVAATKQLGIANNVQAAKLAGGRVEIRIRTKRSSVSSSLADVGFGVNQLLPILVSECQHGKGATLAISQPETHLHPSIQANLGDHFARLVKTKDFRYLIETHSEYLINRIRRLIVRGDLDSKDVRAYHIEQSAVGARVHPVTFEKDGTIVGAPKDFFDTYSEDVLGIALRD